jgi:cobalt/nickel transport system permease protein
LASLLKDIQEKTAFLPDYNFKPSAKEEATAKEAPAWPGIETGTSVAGIVGGAIVLIFILLIGLGIRLFKKH